MESTILGEYYVLKDKIGAGCFSKVYKGFHNKTKNIVAIKKIKNKNINEKYIEREINIISKLDHPNIIKMYEVISNKKYHYLVLEYCNMGDLSTYLEKNLLNEFSSKKIFIQLVEGLKYLYKNQIMHRDLKPQNILLKNDIEVKISDFGFANFYNNLDQTICGSPYYMAPEILTHKKYTNKADLWSLGIILYQMLVGKLPYQSGSINELLNEINSKQISLPPNINITLECNNLLNSLLEIDYNYRIDWNELFKHEWINNSKSIENNTNIINDNSIPIPIPKKNTNIIKDNSIPIPIPKKNTNNLSCSIQNLSEPLFNNKFHSYNENDFIIISSPPQNIIDDDINNSSYSEYISKSLTNLKKSIRFLN